ncbi:FecR family protein [Olivibacter domesticus]|uniref:FecR family protein n=1 Tax=Olivibacter domesticus TaxID=407022 RepID=A0A1H7UWH5_OLID1|nr:FecR domain-containing protein [Olivibacter domesticus]SEM00817.1 FecR family protein [Olivibacter domesticus]
MTKDRLLLLVTAYLENQIQPADYQELVDYIHQHYEDKTLADVINQLSEELEFAKDQEVPSGEIYQAIMRDERFNRGRRSFFSKKKLRKTLWASASIAASIILMLVIFKVEFKWPGQSSSKANLASKIVPGSKKAVLTLADGKTIELDSSSSKALVMQGDARLQIDKGTLMYEATAVDAKNTIPLQNTITTPAGGEYQAVLPDGSKVWLNAASSIRFPVKFTEGVRKVSITGEVYFEVAKKREQPFFVEAKNVLVKVLGTHFNVSAYPDDQQVHTTLLEGSVQVAKGDNKSLLKPGEQARVRDQGEEIEVHKIDIEEVLAWKEGYFFFNHEPLESVMKKMSRWYDVEIVYKGDLSGRKFDGTISRMDDIQQMIKALEMLKTAHFVIEGRRVIVMD